MMKSEIAKAYNVLLDQNKVSDNNEWQSISIDKKNPLVEVTDLFLNLGSTTRIKEETNADLPWSEDHFQERICGKPINPGNQYKNWPYYKGIDNDNLFRDSGKFSHNYMERYWCKGFKGIRFNYGDLNDIIERLKNNTYTRQAFLSVWHPEDQSNEGVRVPCTIGYWFYRNGNELDCTYLIRSCDAVRHFRNDIYMTYRLLEHVGINIGLLPGNLKMWIGSFHCFQSDLYTLKKYVRDTIN